MHKRKGFKCALVCADTFRAGAFDQLKQNATKAKIPFYGSYTETDPAQIAAEGVNKFREEAYEIIIVDTSGRHAQEAALFEEMEQVASAVSPDEVVFVMDSSIGQAAHDQASAFKNKVSVGSVIVTKLDGHAKGGGALSAVAATGAPITHIGTGEHIEDFEDFEVSSFVSRMLGKGNIAGLMEKMKQADVDLEKQAPEMMKRLTSGQWTLRDMREQFQAVLKMGPLSNIMNQFPGMSGLDFHDSGVRIKKWLTMMDSMTDAELDETKTVAPQRIVRIAKGSGHHPMEVMELLEQFKLMQTTMQKTMKKNKKMGKGGMDLHNMDAATVAQMMHKMNPQMLAHLGGQAGLEQMMVELEGGDPDVAGPTLGSLSPRSCCWSRMVRASALRFRVALIPTYAELASQHYSGSMLTLRLHCVHGDLACRLRASGIRVTASQPHSCVASAIEACIDYGPFMFRYPDPRPTRDSVAVEHLICLKAS